MPEPHVSYVPLPPPRLVGRRIAGFALSLFVPSSGHVLLGRPRRGLVLVATALVLILSVPWTRAVGTFGALLVYLAIPVDVLVVRPGPRPAGWRLAAMLLGCLVVPVGLRVGVRGYYLEAFKIPSSGMAPTLLPGDRLFIEKFRRDPARGDVIVFRHPQRTGYDFIERVVGVGGDRIEVRDRTLYVNGAAVPASARVPCEYGDVDDVRGGWITRRAACAEETLGRVRYTVAHAPDDPGHSFDFPAEGAAPYEVPAGTLFVMGDNRENSNDSRFWGAVPVDHVKGTALFTWWSSGPDGVRWDRIGTTIR